MSKIRIGIVGYGNLGRGTELAIRQNPDMELACVFTRRDPSKLNIITENVPVYSLDDIADHRDSADVLILCGGSASDLPVQGPKLAEMFCTVDSFDTHAKIPKYFASVDESAKKGGNISIISVGWDPGLFSIMRQLSLAPPPCGSRYPFWGLGRVTGTLRCNPPDRRRCKRNTVYRSCGRSSAGSARRQKSRTDYPAKAPARMLRCGKRRRGQSHQRYNRLPFR